MLPSHIVETIQSMHLEGLTNTLTRVDSFRFRRGKFFGSHCLQILVYNHVLKLDLSSLQWHLVDNYGDIPGVRMGKVTASDQKPSDLT